MPATRRKTSIEIVFEEDETILQVNVKTIITVTEGGLTVTSSRPYGELYSAMDTPDKARIDAIATQMQSFIDNQEPIV